MRDIKVLVHGEKYSQEWDSCKPHENLSHANKSWFAVINVLKYFLRLDVFLQTSDKDIEYLANGLVKGDKRIRDLLSVQYELEGRIRYLEIKVSSVNSLICKLEEELSEEVCSLEEMTCKKTIKNRVTYLDSSFGCILKRIEKLEQSFSPSQQGPSAEASGETSKPGQCYCIRNR